MMHAHKCEQCQTVFYHSNEMRGNAEAHKCPNCGASQWQQFQPVNAQLPRFEQPSQPATLHTFVEQAVDIVYLIALGACLVMIGVGLYRYYKEGGAVQA